MSNFENGLKVVDQPFAQHVALGDVILEELVCCVEAAGEQTEPPANGQVFSVH